MLRTTIAPKTAAQRERLLDEMCIRDSAEIGSDLKSLQAAVGGYIEAAYFFDDPVALICNEEGKVYGMPYNLSLIHI